MSESPTEVAIRFIGELVEAVREGTAVKYVAEYMEPDTAGQRLAVKYLAQAQEALKILHYLGEYTMEHEA